MNRLNNRSHFYEVANSLIKFKLKKQVDTRKKLLLLIYLLLQVSLVKAQNRTIIELTDTWKFSQGQSDQAFQIGFDDATWQTVSVPHDWAIYGPFNESIDKYSQLVEQNLQTKEFVMTGRTGALPFIGQAWYRKHFKFSEYKIGQKILLTFDGVMSQPVVYLNGEKLGQWNNGYNYFYFDISDKIKAGQDNVLAVNCSNLEQSSRWYPGAGIYRKVRLVIKNADSVEQWGTFITTPIVTPELAKINVKTKVSGEGLTLVTEIVNPMGEIAAADTTHTDYLKEFDQNILVNNPQLWSPDNPNLYQAVTKVYKAGKISDQVTTTFGIRTISYKPDRFRLNGEVLKIKGVCMHHDQGPLGAALNISALRRQLSILKNMGCNAIRTSHNMPSLEQLELCDEMGFMVLAESFDEWAMPKVKNGYNKYFETDYQKDIEHLVRATRNHPSIIMWSAGNEVPDQRNAEGVKRARCIMDIFHSEDPTRPVTVGMNEVAASMKTGFGAVVDIPGLNYNTKLYPEAYEKFPQGFLLGSETASTISSRGIYKFPVEKTIYKQYDDHQCCSYDLGYCFWSNLPDIDFALQDDNPWVLGEFVWTGFDYLGEPSPYDTMWPARSSFFGMVDLAGLPKDRYYLYRSRWNTKESTLHILPHWTWPGREGQITPVFVYTNCDKAELFVNGKSQGTRQKNDSTLQNRNRLMWMNVKYEPGEIKVIAFDKNGNPAKETKVVTADKPYRIVLEPDRTKIAADGQDLCYVTVSVVDKKGIPCPTATNQLNFEVSGYGSYRAACNGDATSLEMFHLPTMKLFSGKLVVLVQSLLQPGPIKLTVKGNGLKTGVITLNSYR